MHHVRLNKYPEIYLHLLRRLDITINLVCLLVCLPQLTAGLKSSAHLRQNRAAGQQLLGLKGHLSEHCFLHTVGTCMEKLDVTEQNYEHAETK